ncbi:unnamed protein product [Polarella glacialis]|uniref:RNA-editing substrate-binding complex 8 protein HEAT repeats domain-containing protein n=1 Tax=Polarella glacialis TaxID=89957 RepID=A0A813IWB8_POLGL|nr:unnamed protein product [Polarella glacialis]
MQAIASEALKNLASFSNQEFSSAIWAFAKLDYAEHEEFLDAVVSELLQRLSDLTPQDLSMLAWSLAHFDGPRSKPALEAISWEVLKMCSDLGPQDIANICWACATAGFENALMMSALAKEVVKKVGRFGAQDLANTVWAFAKLGMTEDDMFDAIAAEVIIKVGSLLPQNLSIISWGYAKLGLLNDSMMEGAALASAAEPPGRASPALRGVPSLGVDRRAWGGSWGDSSLLLKDSHASSWGDSSLLCKDTHSGCRAPLVAAGKRKPEMEDGASLAACKKALAWPSSPQSSSLLHEPALFAGFTKTNNANTNNNTNTTNNNNIRAADLVLARRRPASPAGALKSLAQTSMARWTTNNNNSNNNNNKTPQLHTHLGSGLTRSPSEISLSSFSTQASSVHASVVLSRGASLVSLGSPATSPISRNSLDSLVSRCGVNQNTPWDEYTEVSLAPGVSRQLLEIPCDGPPGILRVAFTSARLQKGPAGCPRGTVLCAAGCYECMEGPSCLYNKLASLLPQTGISVLQLAYRPPGDDEEEAAEDVMTCVDWLLARNNCGPLLLIGWSMGSAAVVEAAYLRRNVPIKALITLAAQTAGTRRVKDLEIPLLALHGLDDTILRSDCSKTVVQRAQNGVLRLLPDTTHRMEHALPHVLEFVDAHLPTR